MSTTDPVFDIEFAPAGTAARLVKSVVSVVSWLWTLRKNRKAVNELQQMDDWQLFDIGLKRSDLHIVATSRFFEDPSAHLSKVARSRQRHS
jgi:uncharacterized protein YjiS (DUF1127 family)